MKHFLVTIGFLIIQFAGTTQIRLLGTAGWFAEPENGYVKLLLLKNGNTAYICTNDEGMQIKLYNSTYKEIVTKEHKFRKEPLRYGKFETCFELDGKIVVVVNELKKGIRYNYKAEINAENGDLISFESVDDLVKKYMGDDWGNLYKIKDMLQINMFKDPYSEFYTLLCHANTIQDKQVFVACILDKKDQVVKSSWYAFTPENARMKNTTTVGYVMNSDQAVYVVRKHAFNRSEKYPDSELELIVLNNNKAEGISKMIDVKDGEQPTDVLIKFNPVTKDLHIVTQVDLKNTVSSSFFFQNKTESEKSYSVAHRLYNTEKGQFQLLPALDMADINMQYKKASEDHGSFRGALQNFFVHPDGGYSYVIEGLKTVDITTLDKNSFGNQYGRTSTMYNLGTVVVLRYSKEHQKQMSGMAIKEQMLNNSVIGGGAGVTASPLYHYAASMSTQRMKGGNQYKSFGFITGKANSYILFNDLMANTERLAERKDPKVMKFIDDCNGYYHETNAKDIMPLRKLLTPMSFIHDWQPYIFTVCDYDQSSGKYVTLKLTGMRDKSICPAWFQVD